MAAPCRAARRGSQGRGRRRIYSKVHPDYHPLDLGFTLAHRFLKYGAFLGTLASLLTVLFWAVLFYIRADGAAQAQGLEAAIFLLTTIVSFPLSLLTVAALGAIEYQVALVRLAIVVGPILNLALWGYFIGVAADLAVSLRAHFARTRNS